MGAARIKRPEDEISSPVLLQKSVEFQRFLRAKSANFVQRHTKQKNGAMIYMVHSGKMPSGPVWDVLSDVLQPTIQALTQSVQRVGGDRKVVLESLDRGVTHTKLEA